MGVWLKRGGLAISYIYIYAVEGDTEKLSRVAMTNFRFGGIQVVFGFLFIY